MLAKFYDLTLIFLLKSQKMYAVCVLQLIFILFYDTERFTIVSAYYYNTSFHGEIIGTVKSHHNLKKACDQSSLPVLSLQSTQCSCCHFLPGRKYCIVAVEICT